MRNAWGVAELINTACWIEWHGCFQASALTYTTMQRLEDSLPEVNCFMTPQERIGGSDKKAPSAEHQNAPEHWPVIALAPQWNFGYALPRLVYMNANAEVLWWL
jgi:hypothetical protein